MDPSKFDLFVVWGKLGIGAPDNIRHIHRTGWRTSWTQSFASYKKTCLSSTTRCVFHMKKKMIQTVAMAVSALAMQRNSWAFLEYQAHSINLNLFPIGPLGYPTSTCFRQSWQLSAIFLCAKHKQIQSQAACLSGLLVLPTLSSSIQVLRRSKKKTNRVIKLFHGTEKPSSVNKKRDPGS